MVKNIKGTKRGSNNTLKNKGFLASEKPVGTNTLPPKVLHENEKP
jgi:hypothetical protein